MWLTVPIRHRFSHSITIDEAMVVNTRWATKHIMALKKVLRSCRSVQRDLALAVRAAGEPQSGAIPLPYQLSASQGDCSSSAHREHTDHRGQRARTAPRVEGSGQEHANSRDLSGGGRDLLSFRGRLQSHIWDEPVFNAHGIDVAWISYEGYPVYPQLWGAFRAESLNYRPPPQHRRPRERVFPAARRAWCRPRCVTHGPPRPIAEGLKLRFDGIERTLDPIMTRRRLSSISRTISPGAATST